MELGFLESDEEAGLLLRQVTSDWVSWDGGLAGGLEPIWLAPPQDASLIQCSICKNSMTFLLQIYAPLDEVSNAFHRDLNVFICSTCNTPDSVVCIRSQLAKENDFYPTNVDDGAEGVEVPNRTSWTVFAERAKPKMILGKRLALVVESEEGLEAEQEEEDDDDEDEDVEDDDGEKEDGGEQLKKKPDSQTEHPCVVCAALTKTRCGACQRVYYCSREHQAQDWKAKHKKECLDFQDEKTSQRDLDQAASFGDNKRLEQLEASKDRMFRRFMKRTRAYPDQVLRYRRWPENSSCGLLWTNSHGILDSAPPDCEHCGSSRKFEMQITPQFLSFFMKQGGSALDFGTIVVYTCTQSCDGSNGGFAKEFAYRQNVT